MSTAVKITPLFRFSKIIFAPDQRNTGKFFMSKKFFQKNRKKFQKNS